MTADLLERGVSGTPSFKPLTAADIRVALRQRYGAPEAAIAFEVAQGTGTLAHRHLDAVAMDLWPSRGLALHGIEIKVNIYDWRREKANPEKAEQIARFCDYFWVAAPKGMIPIDELPEAWGLIEVDVAGKHAASKRAEKTEAQPITRAFMAAMLRAHARHFTEDDFNAAYTKRFNDLEATFRKRVEDEAKRRAEANVGAAAHWRELVEALGEEPDHFWRSEDLIAAVKAVMASGAAQSWAGLRSLYDSLDKMRQRVGEAIGELKIPEPKDLDATLRRKRRAA